MIFPVATHQKIIPNFATKHAPGLKLKMKKAIIVGASSGIGRALAQILADHDFKVGISGRRTSLLESLHAENPNAFIVSTFDVCHTENAIAQLEQLVRSLGGLDLLVLSSGTGELNEQLDFALEKPCIDTNVTGFTAVADWAFNYFQKQQPGHFAAITSVAGLRGNRLAPAYNASKAFQINYLEGLRQKAQKLGLPICITDIRPGFVDTEMAKGDGKFWVAPVKKAAQQIFRAILLKKRVVYVTRRWRLVAFLVKSIPGWIFEKM